MMRLFGFFWRALLLASSAAENVVTLSDRELDTAGVKKARTLQPACPVPTTAQFTDVTPFLAVSLSRLERRIWLRPIFNMRSIIDERSFFKKTYFLAHTPT